MALQSGLFTDLYELTMMQAYLQEDMTDDAVFSLFVRRLPPQRNLLLACGLDTVLDYLQSLQFTGDEISYLRSLNRFSDSFLNWLADFRFTGDVFAVPEGTPVFANEPIMEVRASLPQAQLIETFIMNQVHVQTMLASKALRVVQAAQGRPVIDFGARRMHGTDAALKAARSFYIAGVAATSNVLAGQTYGIPVSGTMAHSYIQSHDDETDAFRAFIRQYPDTILLVDTYDTLDGVHKIIGLAGEMGTVFQVRALRLDSGDLLSLARRSRALLDSAGLNGVEIFASGGLDEYSIHELVHAGAPIDGFGVGTNMGVSADAPSLDIAYKLCEYAGKGRLKLSSGKPVLPGRKQVYRETRDGIAIFDTIAGLLEKAPGRPLLKQVMKNGCRLDDSRISLNEIRAHAQRELTLFPKMLLSLQPAVPAYPVRISSGLEADQKILEQEHSPG